MSENQARVKRVRLSAHSTNVSNVVLLGYHHLSDGAKLTYMVLESYDWPDETGHSKGKCWPTIESLAEARGKSYDTVARHIKELEKAGLIRVESGREKGAANCYWILDPSDEESQLYIKKFSKNPSSGDNTSGKVIFSDQVGEEGTSQKYQTRYCENTAPGKAILRDKESKLSQESKIKNQNRKDSNRTQGEAINLDFTGVKPGKSTQSFYLSNLMNDFSRALNDTEHAVSNRTQVNNLFRYSGLDEPAFAKILYEAKKRTQWAALASGTTGSNGPNRAAYFFRVVQDLLSKNQISQNVIS